MLLTIMNALQVFIAFAVLQLAVSISVPFYKQLSSEEAARLAAWTPESKQQMWELSGQFEGDIVLTPNQRTGLIDTKFRWPNRQIPYVISSDFTELEKEFIARSLQTEYSKTCINVRPRRENDVDYVYVTGANTGCWSYVGRVGGPQVLNLQRSAGCIWKGTIAHEFLHAAGFWHQHSATERDDYVTIMWRNIMKEQRQNFAKYGTDVITNFGEKYDYGSVMHYGKYAFSANEKPTIIPKDPKANIGQNEGLSKTDIIKLNKMYNCI